MNPLTDDPVDADLRAVLQGIEGRAPLSIDVDTVIARGRSRRTAVLAERVLAVAVVLAVVVGATVFAVRSSSDHEVVLGPTPTPTISGLDPLRGLVVDLNGEYTDTATPRTGSTMLLLSNQTGHPVTITGWSLVDAPASARAALATPIANGDYESLSAAQRRALLAAPKRTTVQLGPRDEVNLLVALTASCTAADARIRPSVLLELRAADGTTSRQIIAPNQFAGVMPGGDSRDWVDWAIAKACGDKLPYAITRPTAATPVSSPLPTAAVPAVKLSGAGSFHDKGASHVGITDIELYNATGRPEVIVGLAVADPSGSTKATLGELLPSGTGMDVTTDESSRLDAPAKTIATLEAGQAIKLILSIHPTCTAADARIRPVVSLTVRFDDGTVGQTFIHPLDIWDTAAPGVQGKGWVAVTIAQACARS